jgi:hypothetical protein
MSENDIIAKVPIITKMPDIPADEFIHLVGEQIRAKNAEINTLCGLYDKLKEEAHDLRETIADQNKLIVELKKENSNLKNMEQDYVLLKEKAKSVDDEIAPPTNGQENQPILSGLEELTKARDELVAFFEKNKDVYDAINLKYTGKLAFNYFFTKGNFDRYVMVIADIYGSNSVELNDKYLSIAKKLRNAKISVFDLILSYYEKEGFLALNEPLKL